MAINSSKSVELFWTLYDAWKLLIRTFVENFKCPWSTVIRILITKKYQKSIDGNLLTKTLIK